MIAHLGLGLIGLFVLCMLTIPFFMDQNDIPVAQKNKKV